MQATTSEIEILTIDAASVQRRHLYLQRSGSKRPHQDTFNHIRHTLNDPRRCAKVVLTSTAFIDSATLVEAKNKNTSSSVVAERMNSSMQNFSRNDALEIRSSKAPILPVDFGGNCIWMREGRNRLASQNMACPTPSFGPEPVTQKNTNKQILHVLNLTNAVRSSITQQ